MNIQKYLTGKNLSIVIASIIFAICAINFTNTNVVSVTSNMPKAVRPGATIPVTITIDKGKIDGFGRFTCTLPSDFTATSTNQNFSFADNTITFLWVKLPQSNVFSFDFNIIVPEKSKPFTFEAKFGYVENNEKKFAELKPTTVRVTSAADEIPLANQRVNESTGKADQLFDEDSDYEITRTTETTTQVVSSKPELINDILSSGSAKPTMTNINAEQNQITQTTKTTQVTTTTTTIKPIEKQNNNTQVASTTNNTTVNNNSAANNSSANNNASKLAPKTKPTSTLTAKTSETKIAKPATNANVAYSVQVAASHKKIKNQQNFFEQRNITEPVSVEKLDSWYKYTINSKFNTYVNARNERNKIWESTPIKGAFVVAYNGKKRITVQEALMLSNQKWVK